VTDPKAPDLESFTSVHLFAAEDASATNVKIHQMGCGWNQTRAGGAD
jgi:hypothetical protein